MSFDVIVVGELNVDMILEDLTSFPELGKEITAKNMLLTMGSASALLASNIARLGLKVGFAGKLGRDHFGDIVLTSLKERNVDVTGIKVDDRETTGVTVSLTLPDNYAMVTYMGAMEHFSLDDVDLDYVRSGKHLHHSSFYLQPALRPGCADLFRQAQAAGMTTSFDPDWDPDELWEEDVLEVLDHVDVFLPNVGEACAITGAATAEEALDILCRRSRHVVIKQGTDGAIYGAGDQRIRTTVFKVDPRDTTGAGDSFNAGFLYQWLQGSDIRQCLEWGSACGALATTKIGGTTAMPNVDELQAFLETHTEDIFSAGF